MRFLIIYLLFIKLLFADVFQPNGGHCNDYSYLNTSLKSPDYLAMAMKANSDINIESIKFSGIYTSDYTGNNNAKFKVELVEAAAGVGTLEPTGNVIAVLGEINDHVLSKEFTFNSNASISSGTNFFLKLTPIAPKYETTNYLFYAEECWCDDGNCNENGTLQLGAEATSVTDRNSILWRTNPTHETQLGVYTNTHLKGVEITYSQNQNPCNATVSGNTDTDGDNISDICDLDDDNDGILDVDEGCTEVLGVSELIPYSTFVNANGNGTYTTPSGIEVTFTNVNSSGYLPQYKYNYTSSGGAKKDQLLLTFSKPVNLKLDAGYIQASGESWAFDQTITSSIINPYHALTGNKLIVTTGGPNGGGGTFDFSTLGFTNITSLLVEYGSEWASHNASLDNFIITSSIGINCIDTDGDNITDNLDLDSDNDGCSDANEFYNDGNADGGDNSYYGTGNPPTVTTEGKVIASYTGNTDSSRDSTDTSSCSVKMETIPCEASAFMFHDQPTRNSLVNLTSGKINSITSTLNTTHLNAVGYNKKDNYIWGVDQDSQDGTLIKVGLNTQGEYVSERVKIVGQNFSSFVGDVDDNGHLYIKTGTKTEKRVIVIDLDPNSANYLTKIQSFKLSSTLDIHDWAFNPVDDFLYAVTKTNNKLFKINPTNGNVTSLGKTDMTENTNLGASFFDRNGNMYVYANNSGKIYKIDVANSSTATYFSQTDAVSRNDGAMCSDVIIEVPLEPLGCQATATIFSDLPSDMYKVNLTSGDMSVVKDDITEHINGAGYNKKDGYIWGYDNNLANGTLRRIGKDKAGIHSTQSFKIPNLTDNGFVGDINDDGHLYLRVADTSTVNVIDLDPASNTYLTIIRTFTLSKDISIADWAFNPVNDKLYAVTRGSKANGDINTLVKINPDTGHVADKGDTTLNQHSHFGAAVFDKNGNLYVYHNDDGNIYKITVETSSIGQYFSTSNTSVDNSDGAMCSDVEIAIPLQALTCEASAFMFHGIPTETSSLDLTTGDIVLKNSNLNTTELNAAGYNKKDDYIWAVDQESKDGTLIKIGSDNNGDYISQKVKIAGESFESYIGDVDDNGHFFLKTGDKTTNNVIVIDLDPNSNDYLTKIKSFNLSKNITIHDWAFNPVDDFIYAVTKDDTKLYKIDPSDGTVTSLGNTGMKESGNIGAAFFDRNGNMYVYANKSGNIYRIDVANSPTATIFSITTPVTRNDGAMCSDAEIAEPLMITVSNISKREGDIGHTDFIFTLNFNHPAPASSGLSYVVVDGSATVADNDYLAQAADITFLPNSTEATITISVVGDKKMEDNEQFYLNLSNPSNLTIIDNQSMATILNDDIVFFNVERTNSHLKDNNTQERKEAFYTQISGRDFNYAIVTYEEDSANVEEMISNVTVKVELLDMNNSANVLYEEYLYFDKNSKTSRLAETLTNDLKILSAHQNLRFKVSYMLDENSSIVKGQYDNVNAYTYAQGQYKESSNNARDNFAIRPENFKIDILDGKILRKSNENKDATSIDFAAGYDYRLEVTAQNYNASVATSKYTKNLDSFLEFKGSSNCNDDSNASIPRAFVNGEVSSTIFEHYNVGKYTLSMEDKAWTVVDTNKATLDCLLNSDYISNDGNSMSGCNIKSISDINMNFHPYKFDLNFAMSNLPASGHSNFLYMDTLSKFHNTYAIEFEGNITAKNADSVATTNFTHSCVSEDVILKLDADTLSEDGINQPLQTSTSTQRPRSPVKISRLINYNHSNEKAELDLTTNLDYMASFSTVSANKFLDDNNGTSYLNIKYNINKNISETINPIQVTFKSFDVSSRASNSIANDTVNLASIIHTPKGIKLLGSAVRDFYFTQVAPDQLNYSKISFNQTAIIRTPLNVDIFCSKSIAYCQDTNIMAHTDEQGLSRLTDGWYLSLDHNLLTDGQVQALTPSDTSLVSTSISNNINFTQGRNPFIITEFSACPNRNTVVEVEILPDNVLLYNPDSTKNGRPNYKVSCSNTDLGILSGVGQTGNIIENNTTSPHIRRLSW